ncbi:hypothetical protein [Roseiconus lacunae]|uniref:Uncharacterized protein n=1 Tax=Roseiconus lacunae TaxID=2605694 RepID=A0ABT7PH71_9BACT|nr:hypothetical protein [Roseiconus lacunae]MDM4015835.1 hypothetical protein [Roseiconus lacunae]
MTPNEYLVDQLARDRRREVWQLCDELALLSRYSEDVNALDADGWRSIVADVCRTGRLQMDGLDVVYVTETDDERRASLTQGTLFQ